MIKDVARGFEFRRETIAYLLESLSREKLGKLSTISSNPVITCFGPVGETITRSCTNRTSLLVKTPTMKPMKSPPPTPKNSGVPRGFLLLV